MVAAEHNILENITPLTWRPEAGPIYSDAPSRCTRVTWLCQARGRALPWSKTPISAQLIGCGPLSDATERSTMTAIEDTYRFEFVWIDGDRLPFDTWRGRPVLVGDTAAGSSAALTSVLTASISRLPRISISRCGNAERSSPARDTVSSDTTSSQAKFLVRLSSRLAVLTASPKVRPLDPPIQSPLLLLPRLVESDKSNPTY